MYGANARGASRRSDRSETELPDNGMAEQEFAKLQRQYRIMDGDRRAYSEESQNILRKQRSHIQKLQDDNNFLVEELRLAENRQREMAKDSLSNKRLKDLQIQAEKYSKQISEESEQLKQLDQQIKMLNKSINSQRAKMGGINAASQNNVSVIRNIRVLENRLDKSLVKFNEALAHNRELREQIDNLRRERSVFDTIHKKLERELIEQKKTMAEIIEASNQAYEARDEAQAKMVALREKAEKELAAYNMEYKELTRALEHDRKLKTFMGVKSQDRSSKDSEDKKRRKGGGLDNGKDKPTSQGPTEIVQSYDEAFAKIKEATGIDDIDKLVEKFIEVEDQNFSLFNYVNELNNEIEKLQEQISEVKLDIEKFRGQGVNMDNQRKKILKELEDKLTVTEQSAESYEAKHTQAAKIINQLKSGIQSIFTRIGCDKSQITDMLGSAGVTESNMMQYLGIIEQRTNEILQTYNAASQKDPEREIAPIGLLGQGPQPHVGTVTIVPPSTGDDYDSEEDDFSEDEQRPLTRGELKARVSRGISKRESQNKQIKKKKSRPNK
eukprot:Nk52_evm15s222 gene=Nk52_evmTU15s222